MVQEQLQLTIVVPQSFITPWQCGVIFNTFKLEMPEEEIQIESSRNEKQNKTKDQRIVKTDKIIC